MGGVEALPTVATNMLEVTRKLPCGVLAVYDASRFVRDERKSLDVIIRRLHHVLQCEIANRKTTAGPARRRLDRARIEAHALRWVLRRQGVSFYGMTT